MTERTYDHIEFVVLSDEDANMVPFVAARDLVALLRNEAEEHRCHVLDAVSRGVAAASVRAHAVSERQAQLEQHRPRPLASAWEAFRWARQQRRAQRASDPLGYLVERHRRSTR